MPKPKVLAFFLPQFHLIPENDEWWGEGFTEWTNVRKARPLFKGHHQPRVPKDNRYYDLLDEKTRDWQADLARDHGVSGFCYYHYWFNGKRLLEKPVEQILTLGKPDLPFCLAWANEPWTRAWDGGDRFVLMPQTDGDQADWEAHFQYLLPAFKDPRYIRVDGKPMFLIYRTKSIERLADWTHHLEAVRSPARLGGAVFFMLMRRVADGLAAWCVAIACGIPVGPEVIVLVIASIAVVTMVPVPAGNVGLYELAVVAAYQWVGVAPETALAAALLQHAIALVAVLVPGALIMAFAPGVARSQGAP